MIFQELPPATPITNDFGSSADARASPARPGHGHPIVLTMQHLNCSDITKEDVANIQSARNLSFLAAGNNAVGTTARHVLEDRVDPDLTNALRASAPPRLVSAAARYCCGRWKSSNSEFYRHLSGSSTTDIFPLVMSKCRGGGTLCLWCPTDTKDSLFHARFDTNPPCQEPNTLAINALSLATYNEALMRTGRTIPPERASFPPPHWSTTEQKPINQQSIEERLLNAHRLCVYEEADVGIARKIQSDGDLSTDHKGILLKYLAKRGPENGYVIYKYAGEKSDGRTYSSSLGSMQSLPSSLRASIGSQLFDIDCDCSHPTNLIDCLRASDKRVPNALFRIVTERTQIREMLAEHYNTTTTIAKQLVNAVTYGKSILTDDWFTESGVRTIAHHPLIIEYAGATA